MFKSPLFQKVLLEHHVNKECEEVDDRQHNETQPPAPTETTTWGETLPNPGQILGQPTSTCSKPTSWHKATPTCPKLTPTFQTNQKPQKNPLLVHQPANPNQLRAAGITIRDITKNTCGSCDAWNENI